MLVGVVPVSHYDPKAAFEIVFLQVLKGLGHLYVFTGAVVVG